MTVEEHPGRHAGGIIVLVAAAQFMVVLDVTVVNVALPAIRTDLGFSTSGLQWVVNAYTITFAGFLLLGGRAGDLFGRRNLFLLGVGLFTFASLAGGLAQNTGMLVGARAIQGIGGAVVAPTTLSILTSTFREGAERNRAFAIWGAVGAIGGTTGAIVGGLLTDLLNWRWILFVNIPLGAWIAWRAWVDLPRDRLQRAAHAARGLDVAGALLVTGGLTGLVYGIVSTETASWDSAGVVGAVGIGAALLGAFLVVETRVASAPLLPLRIFRVRQVSAANVVMFLLGATLFCMWYFMSLYLQLVLHQSALRAGLSFLPMTVCMAATATQVSKMVVRLGVRTTLVTGFVVGGAGMVGFARMPAHGSYLHDVLVPGVIAGIGFGMCWIPLTTVAMSGVPREDAGLASGLVNVTRQVGGALGLAVLATLATSETSGYLRAHPGAAVEALSRGYTRTFLAGACLSALGAIAAIALLRPAPPAAAVEAGTVEGGLVEAAALGEAPRPAVSPTAPST